MGPYRTAALAILAALLFACPANNRPVRLSSGPPEPPGGSGFVPPPPVDAAPSEPPGSEGAACLTADDCDSGVCEGEGCGDEQPGTCAPAQRGCTRDLRAYCGCDGATFRTSGSCPGQRYAAPGACP
jgi:hypothetical protein